MTQLPTRRARTTLTPFGDKWFDDFFGNVLADWGTNGGTTSALKALPLDVTESDEAYTLRADLPGIKQEDIHLTFDDHMLTIAVDEKREKEEEGETFHLRERYTGHKSRSVRLPKAASDNIGAKLEHGVLTVTVRKVEEKQPKKIKVN